MSKDPSALAPPQPPPHGQHEQRQGPAFDVWQMPRLDTDRRVVTGTASGIAREIGIDPAYVRVSFVVLTIAGGWGFLLYLVAWFVMARRTMEGGAYQPTAKGVSTTVRMMAFLMIATGCIVLSTMYGLSPLRSVVWPAAFVGAAVALALDRTKLDRFRTIGDIQNRQIGQRVFLGLGLLFTGVILALIVSLSFWQAVSGIVVAALVLVGAAVVFAPIVSAMGTDLLAERRRRIRSEERADMAAHLHDSVLQTLSLIQKRSHDASVVSLARRQERELRTWLFDDKAMNPNLGFRAELEKQMAAVEDMYQLPVEVIVVGDRATDNDGDIIALLKASAEAASNAAKHSGSQRIDVFAEVGGTDIEVFVRDTGVGFDVEEIDKDRAGVRDSIVGRMERHGGTAFVHSTVGTGTEVELRLPLKSATNPDEIEIF